MRGRLVLDKKHYFILLIIFLSVICGYINTTYVKYINVRIYFLDSAQNKIEPLNNNNIRVINSYNNEFHSKYKNILISPENSKEYIYRMEVKSKNNEYKNLNTIYEEYRNDLMKQGAFFISNNNFINEDMTNIKIKNIVFNLIMGIIFIFAVSFFENVIRNTRYMAIKEKYLNIILSLLYFISSMIKVSVVLTAILISIGIIANIIKRNIDKKQQLLLLLKVSIIFKLVAIIGFNLINYIKYRTLYNYTQPDELFYYSTADYLYQRILNLSHLRILELTNGNRQFGYNLFLGLLKVLNNGDILISAKVVNLLIGLVFIFIMYEFSYKLLREHKVAIMTSYMMAILLTFSLFSSIALRDVLLSLLICLLLKEIIIENDKYTIKKLVRIIVISIALCSLRIFVFMIIAILLALYKTVQYGRKRSISSVFTALCLVSLAFIFIILASRFYRVSMFDFMYPYIKRVGLLGYIKGLVLSSVNLDFIVNIGGTIYTSPKAVILRMLYPDTLFLIITFPFMILGFFSLFRRVKDISVIVVIMFVSLITIYTIQYGGWFLRIQLQIFPYQYMVISLGIFEVFKNVRFKFIDRFKSYM
ncbi:hypothetical protein [Clostridium sp. C8-1-8]|uniref:hypothetical protein n=1 Tax=Clostridium sp. C8-1-8 TaxID=2698831 RepID=UPI00136A92EE|nr:hypothetical protein [Clostridium sp. C8-1-8]